ncbi:MAG: hypothetical protein PHV13_02940 [Candidatus ainarchaeum sp.]|nr:hypothetical protein [Candidatus ainarchaeum sp.]
MIGDLARRAVKKHSKTVAKIISYSSPVLAPVIIAARTPGPQQKTAKKIQKVAEGIFEKIIQEVV